MTPEKFKTLLAGHHAGTLTDSEKRELSALLHDPALRGQLEELFVENISGPELNNTADPETLELVYQQVQLHKQPAPVRRIYSSKLRWVAAAAAIIITATASWFLFFNQSTQQVIAEKTLSNDIAAPLSSKAVLLLSDGRSITFDSAAIGQIATEGNINIIKSGDDQLVYRAGATPDGASTLNTLTVPKGSQPMQVTLSDGTRVWLNAASSLTYPAAFTGNDRKVQMTGEGYFEVAKLDGQHFFVSSNGIGTEVLGTHFNVNAYDDEASIKITLLEGSVRVTGYRLPVAGNGQPATILKPGQQAAITRNATPETRNNVDTDEVLAWKEGYFDFSGNDIRSVMRQIARWYDVEVEYQGEITDSRFSGIISRHNSVSAVVKMLESTGAVKFRVEGVTAGRGGKIVVLSK
jgi:transmembrane sensor